MGIMITNKKKYFKQHREGKLLKAQQCANMNTL